MADSRYVIELILNARDNTAGAFQKALGEQKKFIDQQEKDNKRLAKSVDELASSSSDLQTEEENLLNTRKSGKPINDETLKAQENLSKKTKEYIDLKKQVGKSDSEQELLNSQKLKALKELKDAENEYATALENHEGVSKETSKNQAKRFREKSQEVQITQAQSEAIRGLVVQREAIIDSVRKEAEVAKKTKNVDKDKHDQAMKNIDDLKKQYESLTTTVGDTKDANDRLRRAEEEGMSATKDDLESLSKARQRYYDNEERRQKMGQRSTSGMTPSEKISFEIDKASVTREAEAAKLQAESIVGFIETSAKLDWDQTSVQLFELEKKAISTPVTVSVKADPDRNSFARAKNAVDGIAGGKNGNPLKNLFTSFADGLTDSSAKVSKFSGTFRGLLILGVIAFIGQLTTGVFVLAGALTALVSSALSAAGALGGALVAGIGQALPAVGVLAAFGNRVSKVFGALKQSNLEQQQASYSGANAADTQAKSLSGVADAQKALTEARKAAKKALEDLIFAEKGQALSVEEAGFALNKAVSSGGSLAVSRAQLGVESANRDLAGTRSEISSRKKSGIEGSPEVVAALKNLEQAKQGSAQAGTDVTAAAGKLNFLLAGLSDSEVKLYKALIRLQTAWRKFASSITAPLTDSFTFAVNKVVGILDSKQILNAGKKLSEALGSSFTQIFDALFSKEYVSRFLALGEELAKNLKPITSIVINLLNIFQNFAEAGSPALSLILGYLDDIIGSLDRWSSSIAGKKSLTDFFTEGAGSLKGILDLFMAIGNVILAIMGPGGGIAAGNDIIGQMVRGLNNFAEAIKDPSSRVAKFFDAFFESGRQLFPILSPLFAAIGGLIEHLVSPQAIESLKDFVHLIEVIIIPALKTFITWMQLTIAAFSSFMTLDLVAWFTKTAIAGGLLLAVIKRFAPIYHGFKNMASAVVDLRKALEKATAQQVLFNEATAAGSTAVPLKNGEMVSKKEIAAAEAAAAAGTVENGFTPLPAQGPRKTGKLATKARKIPVVGKLLMGAGMLGGAVPLGEAAPEGSKVASIGNLLKPLLSPAGLIAIAIAAIVAAVVGLLAISGRLGDVWKAIKDTFNTVFDQIKKALGELAMEVTGKGSVKEAFKAVVDVLKIAGNILAEILIPAIKAIGATIGFLIITPIKILTAIIHALKGMIEGLVTYFTGVIDVVVGIFTLDPEKILGGLKKVLAGTVGFFKSFAGGIVDVVTAPFKVIEGLIDSIFGKADSKAKSLKNNLGDLKVGQQKTVSGSVAPKDVPAGYEVVSTSYGKGGGATVIRKIAETPQNTNIPKASGEQRRTPGKDKSPAKPKAATKVDNADATSFLNTFDPQTVQLSDAIVKKLSSYWRTLRRAARDSVNDVIDFLKDLRGAKGNGRVDKFVTLAVSDFKRLRNGVRLNMVGISNIVKNQMQNSMEAVKDAAVYMKKTLNDALKAVGADGDLIKLSVGAPPKVTGDSQKAATGGWIGNRGERGKDEVHTILGRGEAVLNWGQQKVVEPALRQVYGFGLDEMFGRTRGLHAGTGNVMGGRASGGRGKLFTQGKASWFGGPNDGMNVGTATGVPDTTPGIALYNQATKNKYFNVYAPNGRWHKERQIDIGPAPWTGKILDITSAALSHFGFNEGNFPTGVGNWKIYGPVGGSGSQGGGGAEALKMPKITGADSPMGQLVSKGTKKMIAGAQKYLDKKTPSSDGGAYATQSGGGGPAGLGNFDGYQVAKWIIPILIWARKHGWKGSLTSGYRSHAYNVAQGRNYHSNHEDTAYPGGAIDVGGYGAVAEGQALANVLKGYRGPRNLVWGSVIKDYGHFSATGHAPGGFVGLQRFANGGHVDGRDGQPVPIVAHAGEWVVNKMQQAKLAMMAGTTTGRVKGALGFGGGPNSFAKGGEVKELTSGTLQAVAENAPSKLKDFTTKINQAFNETFSFIDKQINKNLGNLNSKKFSKNLESMLVSIRKLTNDGGALDALALRITRTFDLATTSANLAIAGFVKVGNKLKKVTTGKDFENAIDPEKIATAEALLQKELQDKLIILRTEWVRSLARINRIIKQSKLGSATRINDDVDKIQADIDKLEKGDENADQKKKIKKLEKRLKEKKKQLTDRQKLDGEKNTAEDKIKGIEDQISETESKQVELKKTAFEERTKADTKTSDATIKQSAYLKSVGELLSSFGGSLFGQTGQELITKSLADNKQAAIDRQTALNKRLEDAKKLAAADPRFQSLVDDLIEQVNESNIAVLETTAEEMAGKIAALQKSVEDKIKVIDTKAALENISKALGELTGDDGLVLGALKGSLENALAAQAALKIALDEALKQDQSDPRWKALTDDLKQKYEESGNAVAAGYADLVQNSITAAEKAFEGTSTTGEFIRGIKERGAALAERMGNRSGAYATRQENLVGRGADLQTQRNTLQALLDNPAIKVNEKQAEELRKKIAELDTTIAENTQETKDLSLEYRKSQVDLITGRSDRTTGLIGSVGGIIANIARATGSSQSLESQIGLAQQIKTALGLEQGGLADEISKAIADQQLGSEANAVLAQLQTAFSSGDPSSFAATLAALSPTIAELDSTLGVTAAGTFQSLINAMITNTTATTDNTANLAELNGLANQPQQFATTAWTKFRTALFNGVGDILPQFQIPQMETGGYITKGGMFNLHPGEFVVNANQSNLPSDSPINITVNEANKPLDVTALASRIAFEKRTRR